MTAHYENAFRGTGLRATQFTILSMLAQTGPMAMSKLATLLGVDRTTLNRSVTPLEKRGMVTSQRGADPRVRALEITPDGRALAAGLLPRWRTAQRSVGQVIARHSIPMNIQGQADDV